jgi:uncharacterized membrane protein (UPF0127 family)
MVLIFSGIEAFSALSCGAQAALPLKKQDILIETRRGERIPLRVEAARSGEERSRGLMYREKLADGEGMLFFFERDEILSFWMKNTYIPLSIAFVSSRGEILEIRDMEARSLKPVRSSRSCRYALEAPQGYFSRAGISPGDRIVSGLEDS